MKKLGKKGTALDILVILVSFVLVTSVVFLVTWKFMDEMKPTLLDQSPSAEGDAAINQIFGYSKIIDYGFALTFFVMVLMSILFAWFIQTHPVMFFLTIFLDIIIVFVAHVVKTVYLNILTLDTLSGYNAYFPLMDWICSNLTIITLVLLVVQAIFMFSAMRDGVL